MGEVYRAHDPRLDRNVAIKVLPKALASDPNRLQRFEQEARAIGSPDHPNILTVLLMTQDGKALVLRTRRLLGDLFVVGGLS
jgi:serine/threonine protein kinase